MILSARGARRGGSPPKSDSAGPKRPGTASERPGSPANHSQPWRHAGARPHSPQRKLVTAGGMTGTRRNRPHDYMHIFIDNPEAAPDAQGNFFWLYGAFDFKMQTPMEEAEKTVFKRIDHLVDRMNRHAPESHQQQHQHMDEGSGLYGSRSFNGAASSSGRLPSLGVGSPKTAGAAGSGAAAVRGRLGGAVGVQQQDPHAKEGLAHVKPPPLKAHLIFDIISTKKHLQAGLPYKLGTEIYEYVDRVHGAQITTTFVGLTDNTARRPGRDVYYTQSDELTKNRQPWSELDGERMIVVFPGPPPSKLAEGSETAPKKMTGAPGSNRRVPSAGLRRSSPRRR